ncbi:MAG: DegT/DnrJ/EryC1/StrS family aminotransferase [Nanoarchaeota archaeon]|nr:DegT/DnrJ/EryC1/StrS family aminotransferase [Nanoarchaeota archaeon]
MPFKYYLNEPLLGEKEIEYTTQVIKQSWLSPGGEFNKKLEESFTKLIGVQYALGVQSGTAALHTALLAFDIKPGDKVVVPSYTCAACVTSVLQTGAIPVLIDVEPKTFGMDIHILEDVLSTQNIKAVMVVHVYGFPVQNFDKIIELCKKYKVLVLEDASEALGATINGKKAGSFGDISVFSIRSEKMIGVGEGGIVLTNNKQWRDQAYFYAARAAPFRRPEDPWWHKYIYTGVGMNYLLPHLPAAIGVAQLENFPEILQKKRFIGKKYREFLGSLPGIRFQEIAPETEPCFWLNCILLDAEEKKVREIGADLIRQGLEVRPAFWPLSDLDAFRQFSYGSQEQSLKLFRSMLVLPSSVKLAENEGKAVYEIAEIIKNTFARHGMIS